MTELSLDKNLLKETLKTAILEIKCYIWAHAMRPYHWGNNIIVGANCIRPLLITSV
ncbi:hypothetical protein [Crocosphaera sp. XPORK-15E]|uniref:hypothetical protein n=1 Tax=Crocosphaera sp. XPORK-15E TaxID=3110247 RepID=UPI002B1F2725|nr:hypothetical protein [Crocosphaera sp. XPORK-15E]MEA5533595.1 hypothetical protein [Crocosphaera sp. XPORK-15E]